MKDHVRYYRYQPPGCTRGSNPLPDLVTPAMPPLELVEAARKTVQGTWLRMLLAWNGYRISDFDESNQAELRRALRKHPFTGIGDSIETMDKPTGRSH